LVPKSSATVLMAGESGARPRRASPGCSTRMGRVTEPAPREGVARLHAGPRRYPCNCPSLRLELSRSLLVLAACVSRLRLRRRCFGARSAGSGWAWCSAVRWRWTGTSCTSSLRSLVSPWRWDGGWHLERAAADAKRDARLARLGLRVQRVGADDVLAELPAMLGRIGRG
jgi:hypothetical protein